MEKILTISVAAYNVAAYLKNALESCVVPEILDDIEVLIENDGSTDETPSIAEEFQDRYPNTFRLINKENGGYGTTVNRSIKEAKGRYFKLLDGDDWFDSEGLLRLVEFLKRNDTDWAITRYVKVKDEIFEETTDSPVWLGLIGGVRDLNSIDQDNFAYGVGMWQLTSRTEILRKDFTELPSHTLYTDQLFVFYQMPFVGRIAFLDFPVYKYRIGRDGQSVSRESRVKHCKEAIGNLELMLAYYQEHRNDSKSINTFMLHRLTRYYVLGIRTYLLLPASESTRKQIIKLERKCKEIAPEVYKLTTKYEPKKNIAMRLTGYLAYYPIVWKGINNWE